MPNDLLARPPIELTRLAQDVSATERAQFRDCHRRWWFDTIQNLESKTPPIELEFGTGMHLALEAYYTILEGTTGGVKNRRERALQSALDALTIWSQETRATWEGDGVDAETLDDLVAHTDMGYTMLTYYSEFDQASKDKIGDVLAVEGKPLKGAEPLVNKPPKGYPDSARVILHPSGRYLVPIVNPETKEPMGAYLSMKLDLISRRPKAKGLSVIDHKNLKSSPSDKGLDYDDQITTYLYGLWRLTGKLPRDAVYNALIKDVPKPPRVGKKGDLSYAKDQRTTPDLYREALREHGLINGRGVITSDAHAACLDSLLAHGWDRFYVRMVGKRNAHELAMFEYRLIEEVLDMQRVLEVPEDRAYPNLRIRVCGYCPVRRICQAIEEGSDYEQVIETQFRVGPDRKAA